MLRSLANTSDGVGATAERAVVSADAGTPPFEVVWDDPREELMPWRHERWHMPNVVSPLGADVTQRLIYGGFREGAANDGTPFRMTLKRING